MFSVLRKGLLYKDISPDISEHDIDVDAESWSYDNKEVYKGSIDLRYKDYDIDVYWLYDDSLKRVGLVEHDSNTSELFNVLWFKENPFSTLLQENWTTDGKTLWSLISNEAYQDLLENDFKDVFLHVGAITPEFIINGIPIVYECTECGKRSFSQVTGCKQVKKIFESKLFLDDSFIIYNPPQVSRLGELLHGAYDSHPQAELQEQTLLREAEQE